MTTTQSTKYRKGRAHRSVKQGRSKTQASHRRFDRLADHLSRWLPAWLLIGLLIALLLPNALGATLNAARSALDGLPAALQINRMRLPGYTATGIAPLFTREVRYWAPEIVRWANEYNLDANLLATVMQIESCGHSGVSSSAGARGLFQVMPFHFDANENQLDPDTNARRGASFLNQCLDWAQGDAGLALACYNGGPGLIRRAFATWPAETQRYYNWGTSIYADAQQNASSSPALESWLNAGGQLLCNRASAHLGL